MDSDAVGSKVLLGNGPVAGYDIPFQITPAGLVNTYIGTVSGAWTGSPAAGITGNWMHVAVTIDEASASNNVSLYINGKHIQTRTHAGQWGSGLNAVHNNLRIGEYGAQYWDGQVQGVAVYEYLLTEDEVSDIYVAGLDWILNSHKLSIAGNSVPDNTIRVTLPFEADSTQEGRVKALLSEITPANTDLEIFNDIGFVLGTSTLGGQGL
jgi:hypothetical protein